MLCSYRMSELDFGASATSTSKVINLKRSKQIESFGRKTSACRVAYETELYSEMVKGDHNTLERYKLAQVDHLPH